MGTNNDAKGMTTEYVKGATIADLAIKYELTEQEVTEAVTKDADTDTVVTQTEEDTKIESKEVKKDK